MSGEENETGWYAELDKADQLRHIWRTDDEGEAELVAVIIGDSDDDYDPVPAQLDHKTARARAGQDHIENLQWLCEEANLAKRALSDEQFIALCGDVMAWIGRRIAAVDAILIQSERTAA